MSAAKLLEYFSINIDIQEELVGIGHVILFNVIHKKDIIYEASTTAVLLGNYDFLKIAEAAIRS